jgi:FixJ family two-component response regulator
METDSLPPTAAYPGARPEASDEALPVVFVVDDDPSVRAAFEALAEAEGLHCETFGSAEAFLTRPAAEGPQCVVLDIGRPEFVVLDLQTRMATRCRRSPIIFLAGCDEVLTAVQALRPDALEFLTKPLDDERLRDAVRNAIASSAEALRRQTALGALRECYATLTCREREVMELAVAGFQNKQAARRLGVAEITVKVHRGRVMEKMAAASFADLVKMSVELRAVGALGIRGVAQRLRVQTELPGLGRRTAAARQATLRATLDWSYQLLSPAEQRALRRLAVFQGPFTLESAAAIAGPSDSGEVSMLELLARLAEKSLLSVDLSREEARYRLLQTTRSFALERLTPREMGSSRARHAREMRRLAEATDQAWGMGDSAQARRDSADLIDDLGAAIEWALSPLGDIDTAVDLVVASTPLLRRLSLLPENARQAEQALEKVRALSPPNPAAEMRLLGSYLVPNYRYEARDQIIPAAERLMVLAEELGDAGRLIVGAWIRLVYAGLLGDNATVRRCADQMSAAATPSTPETYRALAHVARGQILLQDGDLPGARRETEAGLNLVAEGAHHVHVARLGLDPRVYLYDLLVRVSWLQGFPEQSLAAGRACVGHFRQLSQAQSLMYALTNVAAVSALLIGDLDAAADFLDESQRLCDERGERGYYARSQASMQTMLRFARTGIADQAAAAIVAADSTDVLLARPALAIGLAEAIGQSKSPEHGLAALDKVTTYAVAEHGWTQPELLRVRAALARKAGMPVSEAEALLRQALGRDREIGALTLELRAATTLAELLSDDGRPAEALALLTDVIDRMPEGREAADCRRAVALRDTLQGR